VRLFFCDADIIELVQPVQVQVYMTGVECGNFVVN